MTALGWVVYGIAVVSVVITLGLLLGTLQVRFMRELHGEAAATYHAARHQPDNQTQTESEARPRQEPGKKLVIRPLPAAERTRFVDDWRSLQPLFVNDPDGAVKEADRLISDVMQTRGYPAGEIESPGSEISVDHPEIVSHYREAHRLAQRAAHGQATTDEERRALADYRDLFDRLLSI